LTQILPGLVLLLLIGFFLVWLSLLGAYLGVVVIYAATALPFCIWQLKRYYDTIPFSFEEAAEIEGVTRWQRFRLVVLPLAWPGMIITALFSFLVAWNEYIITAIRFQHVPLFTFPRGVESFGTMNTKWGLYAAGAFAVAVAVAILFLIASRFFVSNDRSKAITN
jgi:arabinogalactan oligomer/maltooligosaccharide transport system permease protein